MSHVIAVEAQSMGIDTVVDIGSGIALKLFLTVNLYGRKGLLEQNACLSLWI